MVIFVDRYGEQVGAQGENVDARAGVCFGQLCGARGGLLPLDIVREWIDDGYGWRIIVHGDHPPARPRPISVPDGTEIGRGRALIGLNGAHDLGDQRTLQRRIRAATVAQASRDFPAQPLVEQDTRPIAAGIGVKPAKLLSDHEVQEYPPPTRVSGQTRLCYVRGSMRVSRAAPWGVVEKVVDHSALSVSTQGHVSASGMAALQPSHQ